jgi:hypothetical protein
VLGARPSITKMRQPFASHFVMATIHRNHCSPEDGDSGLFRFLELACQDKFTLPLVFSSAPSLILLLCMPFRLNALFGATVKTVPNYMDNVKIASLKILRNMVLLY